MPWADCTGADYQNRKYNGKEFIEMHGYDSYDYHARHMFPALMRFTTPDPLAEKYYSISPYAYCANNPVVFIDPDGQIIRLANNYKGGIENITKIVATSLGGQVMSHLIRQKDVYTLNSTFWTNSNEYNTKNRYINYVGNTWYKELPNRSDGLKAIFGATVGKESMLRLIKSVTPNQLWKDTQKIADKNEIPYYILKNPGSEVDNKFRATMKERE